MDVRSSGLYLCNKTTHQYNIVSIVILLHHEISLHIQKTDCTCVYFKWPTAGVGNPRTAGPFDPVSEAIHKTMQIYKITIKDPAILKKPSP